MPRMRVGLSAGRGLESVAVKEAHFGKDAEPRVPDPVGIAFDETAFDLGPPSPPPPLVPGDDVLVAPEHGAVAEGGAATHGTLVLTHMGICFIPLRVDDGEGVEIADSASGEHWWDWGELLDATASPGRKQLLLSLRHSSRRVEATFFCTAEKFDAVARVAAEKTTPTRPQDTFAFRSREEACCVAGAWSAEAHFGPQLAGDEDSGWRFSTANARYELCASYPPVVCVPRTVTDQQLRSSAAFRSRGRFPMLAYRHTNGACLVRCSQPGAGLAGNSCAEDEAIVRAISEVTGTPVVICDARSRTAAVGNAALGGGSESSRRYGARVVFLNIEGLQPMQASHDAVAALCAEEPPPACWHARFEHSRWPHHLRTLLAGAQRVADALLRGESVLLHCTDGWDRTAQICSLAEVVLSPRARTAAGLADVIDCHWLAAGHQFASRAGFPFAGGGDDGYGAGPKRGPIFAQFLDALHQIQSQHPLAFDVCPAALAALARAASSYRHADALFDSHRERSSALGALSAPSFLSALRHPSGPARSALGALCGGGQAQGGSLRAALHPEAIRLWRAHFLRQPGPLDDLERGARARVASLAAACAAAPYVSFYF